MVFYDKKKIKALKSKGAKGIRNLKKDYITFQKAPRIGEKQIKKVTRSKKFKTIKRKASGFNKNLQNHLAEERKALRDFYPGTIRF